MKAFWLACCSCEDYPVVRREIDARDQGAQVLRFDSLGLLREVVTTFDDAPRGIALVTHGSEGAEWLRLVADLARAEAVHTVVVLTSDLDPAWIAQIFHAGATEVVAADGDSEGKRAEASNARTGGSPEQEADAHAPLDIEDGCGVHGPSTQLACNADEAVHEAARPVPIPREPERRAASRSAGETGSLPEAKQEDGPHPVTRRSAKALAEDRGGAPVICALAGSGGCGVTTLVSTMACCSARLGLRTAVVDLDLMFGNAYELLGVEEVKDLGMLAAEAAHGVLSERSLVQTSMRVMPDLTLWGPGAFPERAELLGNAAELLIGTLRRESDVVFVDTSRTWTDAVAYAVSACDRCLLVGDQAVGGPAALGRIAGMVTRLGVPRTRMVCVVNRFGQRACTEEAAMRLEMAASLSAKVRIPDGGSSLSSLLAFGRADEAARGQDQFGRSVRAYTRSLLRELACPVDPGTPEEELSAFMRPRLRLPWKRAGEGL